MVTSIVPNDCREHFYLAFQTIWMAEGRDEHEKGVKTKFIYTDDVQKGTYVCYDHICHCINICFATDTNEILDIYATTNFRHELPLVLQDIWHAIQRVDRLLDKQHPDYKAAKGSFSSIFSNIQDQGFESAIQLKSRILEWETKYTTLSSRSAIPLNDLITELGSAIQKARY